MFKLSNVSKRLSIVMLVAVVAALFLLATIAGCRTNDPEPGPNEVWLIGWTYIPDTITVPVGTTVTWNNTTRDYHTVTSDTGLFDGRMGLGQSFNFTFASPGTYGYHDTATDPPTIGQVIVR